MKIELPPSLSKNGFGGSTRPEDLIIRTELTDIRDYIQACFPQPRARFNQKQSSYGLKHKVERQLNRYVSNGELIAAMILCGYAYQIVDWLNCVFDMDTWR
ncbi:MAG: hypothetical protein AAF348_09765 [Bacteroidota bacterium]